MDRKRKTRGIAQVRSWIFSTVIRLVGIFSDETVLFRLFEYLRLYFYHIFLSILRIKFNFSSRKQATSVVLINNMHFSREMEL